MKNAPSWYEKWFDTVYYHQLYRHRNDEEACRFMEHLLGWLGPRDGARVLDLACGRGRHARYLSEFNLDVTGIDLSIKNILYARKYASDKLHFKLGDMRGDLGQNRFDYIFNLFTSFGYFDSRTDNEKALQSIQQALKPGGTLIIDFMNVKKMQSDLVDEEERPIDGILFKIRRSIQEDQIIKRIHFTVGGQHYQFEEKVQLLGLSDFEQLFSGVGMQIIDTFGHYDLGSFDEEKSDRLIMAATAL